MTDTTAPSSEPVVSIPRAVVGAAVLAALAVWAWSLYGGDSASRALSFSLIAGAAFGVVLQRGRFCFLCNFRDFLEKRDPRGLLSIVVALAVGFVLYQVVFLAWVPVPQADRLPPTAHVGPVSPILALAAFVFGLGMAVSRSCLSAHLYRLGEGSPTAPFALVGAALGFVLGFLTGTGFTCRSSPNGRRSGCRTISATPVRRSSRWRRSPVWRFWCSSSPVRSRLRRRRRRRSARCFAASSSGAGRRRSPASPSASSPWRPISASRRSASPPNSAAWRAPPPIPSPFCRRPSTGSTASAAAPPWSRRRSSPTTASSSSVSSPAFAAALVAGQFKPEAPNGGHVARGLVGGILMGWGAMIGLGCTVGVLLSGIHAGALAGWVFLVFCTLGVWLGLLGMKRIGQ
jgi:uncharacterized protein